MDRPHVTYHYRAELPHPVGPAFAWLTDYQDNDATLTSAVVRDRRVLRREADEIEMEATIDPLGSLISSRAHVKLFPSEHRWVAVLGKGRIENEYVLTPTDKGCVLRVEYRVAARKWTSRLKLRLARPRFEREIAAMWTGFFEAMARDLALSANAA